MSVAEAHHDTELRLAVLAYDALPGVWDDVGPLLERACSFSLGTFTPRSVVDGMRSGEFELFAMVDGERITSVMVTCVSAAASGLKLFECLLVGGRDMDAWLPFEAKMDEYARSRGCHRVRAIGRKPLLKKLPHWSFVGVMLEREL